MQKLIILHSNDIHGRVEGLARIATLVEQVRADNPGVPVLYFDAGDIEETSLRLSNMTRGIAMHRLLSAAGCDAAAVGNGGIMRYGQGILEDYAKVAHYPQLLANVRLPDGSLLPGAQSTAILDAGTLKLGLIGVTVTWVDGDIYATGFGLRSLPPMPLISELAQELRRQGADIVLLLSHLGLPDDRKLAEELQNEVPLIIGAHTHHLLPTGERIGQVLIAQAGEYAQHLGRLDLLWDGNQLQVEQVSVLTITADIQPSPRVQHEVEIIEAEIESFLNESIGTLAEPLDFATDRECGVADLIADVLRERMHADLAIVTAGQAFTGPLPAGPLRRGMLWDVCSSSANPAIVTMTGAQLATIIKRGLDRAKAAERPRAFRGGERGLLHLSGASTHQDQVRIGDQPLEPERLYRVAASDWELERYGGYVEAEWNLQPTYETPTIMREAIEDYLAAHSPVSVKMDRLT